VNLKGDRLAVELADARAPRLDFEAEPVIGVPGYDEMGEIAKRMMQRA
jgi:hypothetical protein